MDGCFWWHQPWISFCSEYSTLAALPLERCTSALAHTLQTVTNVHEVNYTFRFESFHLTSKSSARNEFSTQLWPKGKSAAFTACGGSLNWVKKARAMQTADENGHWQWETMADADAYVFITESAALELHLKHHCCTFSHYLSLFLSQNKKVSLSQFYTVHWWTHTDIGEVCHFLWQVTAGHKL